MPPVKLIADSGTTKAEWCLLDAGKKKKIVTHAMSPYFVDGPQVEAILRKELLPKIKNAEVDEVHFYGTGCSNPGNRKMLKDAIRKVFTQAEVTIEHDLLAAARALCGDDKGIVAILGTGSNSCYYNGKKIVKNSPGLGYVLGDEGSGAYLGRKVIQYYLYNTFDGDLMDRFNQKFETNSVEILDAVYKQPFPNRYLASFAIFLAENRGHYMIENIIEDGFNDFFFNHIYKYSESWKMPINFVGGIAAGFKDVLKSMCDSYELELGKVLKNPIDGLIEYHN